MVRRVARYPDDPDPKAEHLAALHIFWQGVRAAGRQAGESGWAGARAISAPAATGSGEKRVLTVALRRLLSYKFCEIA